MSEKQNQEVAVDENKIIAERRVKLNALREVGILIRTTLGAIVMRRIFSLNMVILKRRDG